jgi:hypothetical protein
MVASYGETSGFKAVTIEELMLVNGGKGSSGSSGSSGGGSSGNLFDPAYKDYPQEDRPYDNNGKQNPNSPLNNSGSGGGKSK